MSSDQGLSIFDDAPESDAEPVDAGEETQVLPVTPKDEPAAKAAPTEPVKKATPTSSSEPVKKAEPA
jgi:hypothetical protein